ncbi:MAG: DUF4157 domain-containing protein [Actinomycetota bacterium]|nr:DUF4157 domain-containing protein [Actinomycetota bacterium]
MRDYEVDLEPRDERKSRRPTEAAEVHADIGHAIEAGRPDVVGTTGLLHMQRMAGNSGVASFIAQREEEQSPVKNVIRSEGSPLDAETRSEMETRLGHDFGDVRLHTDSQASASAKSVQAHAYTVGNHVVFGEGTYQPSSDQGKRTLAHELSHVVQQRSGPVDGTPAPGGISVSHPSDRFEQEAERSADAAMSAPPQSASGPEAAPAPASALQRDTEEDSVQGLFVQRQDAPEEEEENVQGLFVQRQEAPEEEEEVPPP